MRPPQNAGESLASHVVARGAQLASMRPPQNAGESTDSLAMPPPATRLQ